MGTMSVRYPPTKEEFNAMQAKLAELEAKVGTSTIEAMDVVTHSQYPRQAVSEQKEFHSSEGEDLPSYSLRAIEMDDKCSSMNFNGAEWEKYPQAKDSRNFIASNNAYDGVHRLERAQAKVEYDNKSDADANYSDEYDDDDDDDDDDDEDHYDDSNLGDEMLGNMLLERMNNNISGNLLQSLGIQGTVPVRTDWTPPSKPGLGNSDVIAR